MAPSNETAIALPVAIVSPTDIARLNREIEQIDNYFQQQAIRQGGEPNAMPRLSKLMDQLAADNQLNLLQPADRDAVRQLLGRLHQAAPVLHISFSVDPPGPYVQKIVYWLRTNIHQHALVTVGLQPNIGAGCVVRTTNKLFDFSLREFFAQKRDFFIEKLHNAIADGPIEQPQVATPEVVAAPAVTHVTDQPATTVSATVASSVAPQPIVAVENTPSAPPPQAITVKTEEQGS